MKNFIRENWFKVSLVLVFSIFLVFYFQNNSNEAKYEVENEVLRPFIENNISSATEITCTYPQMLSVSYVSEISHSLDKPETNPFIFTFSQLNDPKRGQLSYVDSTQTITNVPLIKLNEDEEKIVYVETTSKNYLSTHTIYKKIGVSVYTKSVSLVGIPFGSLSMGSCVGY